MTSTVQATLNFSLVQNIVNLMTVYVTIIVVLILSLQLVTCQLHCSVRIVIVLLL